jgi:tetratricopeptide (TPR) repeat protein
LKDAEEVFQEALKIRRQLSQSNPSAYLPYVATTLNNLGALYSDTNKLKEAEEVFQEALKIRRQLSESNPSAYLPYVATILNSLGLFYFSGGRQDEAQKHVKEALELRRGFYKENPSAYGNDLAKSLLVLSLVIEKNNVKSQEVCPLAKEAEEAAFSQQLKEVAQGMVQKHCP